MPSDAAGTLLGVVLVDAVFLAATVLLFWVAVFVARRLGYSKHGYGLGALGLSRPRIGYVAGVFVGFAVGAGALVTSLVLTPLSLYVAERLGYSTELRVQGPLMRSIRDWVAENPGTAIPTAVFVMVVFAPAVEEIIFRGAVFGGMYRLAASLLGRRAGREKHGASGGVLPFFLAAVVSSALFAALHLEPLVLPALLVLSVALCALYWKTGSILPAFVAHATFNSLAVLVVVLMGLGVLPAPPQ